jgi:hypothetical protein
MADFCKACSIQVFGEDYGDLAGLTTPENVADGLYCNVLCKGCGAIQVHPDCSRLEKSKEGLNMGDEHLLHRRGKFTIAGPVFFEASELLLKIMAGVLVMEASYSPTDGMFSYGGVCADFDPIAPGDPAPSYDVAYDEDTETATWTRVD